MFTQEIPRSEWKSFFDDLTRKRIEWQTQVEIFSDEIGDQLLDEGLPFRGITAESRGDEMILEIMVGPDNAPHQTHNIIDPSKISYLSEEDHPSGIVEIEEADGTKTLVHIIRPMPLVVRYTEELAAV